MPIGFDVTNPKCKSSTQEASMLSIPSTAAPIGTRWIILTPGNFDRPCFLSNSPQRFSRRHQRHAFRFIQRSFTAARDAWALDNVRVLRFLPTDWAISEASPECRLYSRVDAKSAVLFRY